MILQIATALAIGVYVVLSKDVHDIKLSRHHRQLQNHDGSPCGRHCQKAFCNSLENMDIAHVPSPLTELRRTVARLRRWQIQNKRSL
jgi:hypothetical protein